MKRTLFFGVLVAVMAAAMVACSAQMAVAQKVAQLKFSDAREMIESGQAVMIGRANANSSDSAFYYRLPERLHGVARQAVWDLSKNSAGIAIRFSSNAKCIGLKWTLVNNFSMAHMAGTGIRGLDLYTLDKKIDMGYETDENKSVTSKHGNRSNVSGSGQSTGAKFKEAFKSLGADVKNLGNSAVATMEGKEWKYVGVAFPNGKNSESVIVREMAGGMREYLLYLPLYDGIEKLEIGVDSAAVIEAPQTTDLVPDKSSLPIVFYGTSVTQGGCASRPGMAYPAIVERALDRETVNLGFSGNGRMDSNLADEIAKIDASAYVIDCLANCTYETTRDSSEYFISTIAAAHPDVPVYMVTNYHYPQQFICPKNNDDMVKENALWKSIYEKLKTQGAVKSRAGKTGPLENLRFIDISSERIIGNEDTVDGTHLTDKGFSRLANVFISYLK